MDLSRKKKKMQTPDLAGEEETRDFSFFYNNIVAHKHYIVFHVFVSERKHGLFFSK